MLDVVAAKVQPVIEEVQMAAKVISEAVTQEVAVVEEAVAKAADPSPKAVALPKKTSRELTLLCYRMAGTSSQVCGGVSAPT